jgi:hypothetical protein
MWLYKEKTINSIEDLPTNAFGFIYITTHVPTGKKYLGKKSLNHTLNKKLGKKELAAAPITRGRTKSTKQVIKESDWKTYYGSNTFIKNEIKSGNQHDFTRVIIDIATNKKHLTYLETKYLFNYEVLEKPTEWMNDNVLGKFYSKDFN